MPFGLHSYDLIIVAVVALLVFGPKRLPQMGSSVGKTIQEFRKTMTGRDEHTSETPALPAAKSEPIE